MTRHFLKSVGVFLFAGVLALAGCSGENGAPGAPGAPGTNGTDGQDLTRTAAFESCAGCHEDAGSSHQAVYNQYKDESNLKVTINGVESVINTDGVTYTSKMTFTITNKDGSPYSDLAGLDQKRYIANKYDSATRQFITPEITYANPTSTGTAGQFSVTSATATFAPETSNAQAYVYVADGALASEGMTLYSDVSNAGLAFGDVATYESTANVAACEKCHGTPYLKHGYRAAKVAGLPDFAACKACHLDDKAGGHQGWQLLVDDPAAYAAQNGVLTDAQKAKYPYKRSVMNDTHMSHAMEFAYPQSMANCATCHEGKLAAVLTDANFTLTTCKSCHPVTGSAEYADAKRAPSLKKVLPDDFHDSFDLYAGTTDCSGCHRVGGLAATKVFSALHSGYDKKIYADAAGTKYSEIFKVTVDTASLTGNVLKFKFTATEATATDVAGLAVTDITPTVMIGLYGYDTKDYIVSAHAKDDGVNRNLEWAVGSAAHPRFAIVSAANGVWEITADLTDWAAKIADGTIKRAEIAVMPALKNAAGDTLALNAPSRTFDLKAKAFTDAYFKPIVDVAKCNACHDALATTFHSGNRGGSVVVCRMCHTTREGGGHLEMQSRSIDSYVHAIHSFQAFDIGEVDFSRPNGVEGVPEMRYEHHIASTYPNFTILNCESCHNPGTYDVPDQSKSLPGVLSAAAAVTSKDRNIGAVPSYVTGPASRACGSCHRADMINADSANALTSFNEHTASFGTLVEASDGVFDGVIEKLMSMFK
jgi:OmcA/MtrC family decaheme c-type cytochrome